MIDFFKILFMHLVMIRMICMGKSENDPSAQCLSQAGLAGIIFGCISGTLLTSLLTIYVFWKFCWAKNSIETITDNFCYDNPQYGQVNETTNGKEALTVSADNQGLLKKSEKKENQIHEYFRVPLKSKDFTGLGFGIYGNMRDGMFVKNLLNKGPAKDAGKIREGDRIMSIEIDFENIVLEDALTILSYASPYPICLELKKCKGFVTKSTLLSRPSIKTRNSDRKAHFHPLYKSQSTDDMTSSSLRHSGSDQARASLLRSEKKSSPDPANFSCMSHVNSTMILNDTDNKQNFVTTDKNDKPNLDNTVDTIQRPARAKRELNKMKRDEESRNNVNDLGNFSTDLTDNNNLSHEHAMQIIRLSYEDPQVSRSAPDLFIATISKISTLNKPTTEKSGELSSSSSFNNGYHGYENGAFNVVSYDLDESSRNGSTTCNPLYSTSSSSEDFGEFNKEQYDKLLYFQRELLKQHEDLAKLGVNLPFQGAHQKHSLQTGEKY